MNARKAALKKGSRRGGGGRQAEKQMEKEMMNMMGMMGGVDIDIDLMGGMPPTGKNNKKKKA